MPLPRSVERGSGELVLNKHFRAAIDGSHDERLDVALDRMLRRLDRMCGDVRRPQQLETTAPAVLTLKVAGPGGSIQSIDEDESYKLRVTSSSAEISAQTDVGAMHAMETFLQLVEVQNGACRLPAVAIDDAPRFAWRGLHLDVSRHFEPIAVIKRTLDGMAVAKLNVFHWHLSDDQGFRAESKKFPRFTEVASNGQFYTQEEMRGVVAYARARGIRVVPEFDIPGHTSSWLLAYPEIGAGEDIKALPVGFGIPQAELDPSNEKTYKFLDALIGEMGEIFPDAYFHIGGDETEGKGWLENPHIADFMKKHDLQKPADLQAYFNRKLLPILTKHGKKMMGWDEILNPALPKDIMIQSWRGVASLSAGAAQGYSGILSAPYYLDAQKTSEEMFLADPIPADTKLTPDQQKLILGGEVCMWAEQIHEETVDSRIWPRTLAIAERFWSPQSNRDVPDMYRRLRIASLELEDAGLTHITGPEKLRRSIAGDPLPLALEVLASVTEPVSFSERYQGQHTDALTSLDRMVDALVPDPASRQQIAHAVDAYLKPENSSEAAVMSLGLREAFKQWQQAAPQVEALCQRTPRLSDVTTRAQQLGQLGTMGLEALSYLDQHVAPPAGWQDAQLAILTEANKPSGLIRFTFLPSMRKLIEAAGSNQQK
jgi:hexosaminidase